MEKEKWWVRLLKVIGLTGLGMIINNQKGYKGTDKVDKVNDVIEELKDKI